MGALAARRRIVQPRGVRGPSRTNWGRTIFSLVTVGASTKVLLGVFILDNLGIAETVRRFRGRFLVVSDQVANTEINTGAFGMIVVNDLAAAVGATAIPGPFTDASDGGWFVWEPIVSLSSAANGAAGVMQTGGMIDYDSKAMRRIEPGFQIAIMAENAGASFVWQIAVGMSLLTSRV